MTLSNANQATVTIQGASQGSSDVTVTYTLNGEDDTADQTITVQTPSALGIFSDTGTQNHNCYDGNNNVILKGRQRSVIYQVLDLNSQPIAIAGIPMVEAFTPISNTCSALNTPPVGNGPTLPGGHFGDDFAFCRSACLPADANLQPLGSCSLQVNHTWSANGLQVFNHTLTYTCTSITPQ